MLAKHLVLFMQLPCSSLTSEGPWRTTNLKNKCLVSRRLCKERPPLPTTQSRGCGDPHHLHFQSFSFSYWNAVTICRIYAAMHHDHAICHKVHKGFSWNMFNGCSGSIQIQYESNMNPIWSICTMVQRWWKYPCQPSNICIYWSPCVWKGQLLKGCAIITQPLVVERLATWSNILQFYIILYNSIVILWQFIAVPCCKHLQTILYIFACLRVQVP